MRLTLRTLLSYLDDTLEPAEAKLMGEKVAVSEVAPELIERLKRVTRRRGLSAPPVTGAADDTNDPNTVAEYLDNTLPAEQTAEVEEAALQADASLAEIAACHQILTLVLGEPAKVPPTARQHMYRLVKGPEAIPYRRPTPAARVAGLPAPAADEHEADEALLLGLSGSRLLVPVAGAAVLVILLIAVIWMAIPAPKPAGTQGYIAVAGGSQRVEVEPRKKVPVIDTKKKTETETKKVKAPDAGKKEPDKTPEVKKAPAAPELLPEPRVAIAKPIVGPADHPDADRRVVGRLDTSAALLVRKERGTASWERVEPGKEVATADTLVALPGNHCELRLEGGVRLTLWGSLPQYHTIPVLDVLESRVVLHVPPLGFDADFTLESGRVFITRPVPMLKRPEPAKVRVRFRDEIWDVTLLDAEAEVCFDRLGLYAEGVPFSREPGGPAPTTEIYFALLRGTAGLRVKFKEYPELMAPTRAGWDSATHEVAPPAKIRPDDMEWWNRALPEHEPSKQMQAAVKHFDERVAKPDAPKPEVVYYAATQDDQELPARRVYAAYCLQAIDDVDHLARAMGDDFFVVRGVAIRAAQHWCGQAADRDLRLYRQLIDSKAYTEPEARTVLQLMHPLRPDDLRRPDIVAALFDALKNEKVTVRELAYQQLAYADPAGAKEVGALDVAAPEAMRDAQVQKWKASWKRRNEK
jgi:hypothetical protein